MSPIADRRIAQAIEHLSSDCRREQNHQPGDRRLTYDPCDPHTPCLHPWPADLPQFLSSAALSTPLFTLDRWGKMGAMVRCHGTPPNGPGRRRRHSHLREATHLLVELLGADDRNVLLELRCDADPVGAYRPIDEFVADAHQIALSRRWCPVCSAAVSL